MKTSEKTQNISVNHQPQTAHRILIVDDETRIRDLLARIMEQSPHKVEVASDGIEALAALSRDSFDLIVVDLRMPGMDGETLMREVRKTDERIAFIVLTGHGGLKQAYSLLKEFRISDFIQKPLQNSEQLLFSVENALEKQRLEQQVKEYNETLIKMNIRFQQAQKLEAIGSLAGGIAHEFNNALGVITGNIELLKIYFPDLEKTTYVESMEGAAHRMANLADQLLAYARGGKYQPKIISLSGLIKDTLPIIKQNIDLAIRVEADLSMDVSRVEADPTQLLMVLSAVLNNASEAMEGEGCIKITTSEKEVDEEFAKEHLGLKAGRYVCLNIEDDGKGMDEETRSKVFVPFFTTKSRGRGLGMAAMYGIIRNHHGWISVDSELGNGSVVCIYLPAIAGAQARPAGLTAVEAKSIDS